jgi:hypothetical protein
LFVEFLLVGEVEVLEVPLAVGEAVSFHVGGVAGR